MKKILFAALALVALFTAACTKNNDQILVRFQNSTTSAIEESRMEFDETNSTDVGAIPAGETTDYIVFDDFEVEFGSELPTGFLKGKKDGVEFFAWSGNWCGTGVTYEQLEPGQYTIEITESGGDPVADFWIRFVE